MILSLPVTVLGLYATCNSGGCPAIPVLLDDLNIYGVLAPFGWFLWQLILYQVFPGETAQGTLLRDGSRRNYKINAWYCFQATILVAGYMTYELDLKPWIWIADQYFSLAVGSMILATLLAISVYARSFRSKKVLLSEMGNSGYITYDFWMGRELNPTWTDSIDLKYFCELRPGLIGWTILNLALAAKQYEKYGSVSWAMILVVIFQGYYVVDALLNERAILTTMDITTDGFGFMLAFGDLVWVPFTYSLQARYLTLFPSNLSNTAIIGIISLKIIGLYIFRSANSQKNAFRTDPNQESVSHLKFMETEAGSKLLISGWWGKARHINYTGDWLMGLSWCLPCGFRHPLPYFYAIYFAILLIHRAQRDEAKCQKKYKKDWNKYCQLVPYQLIPGII
jgi:protein-S-isoprenylcysteine O-methyltransferase Ste14